MSPDALRQEFSVHLDEASCGPDPCAHRPRLSRVQGCTTAGWRLEPTGQVCYNVSTGLPSSTVDMGDETSSPKCHAVPRKCHLAYRDVGSCKVPRAALSRPRPRPGLVVSDLVVRVWAVATSSQLPRPLAHTPAGPPAGTRSSSGDTF
ncbi:hypothetical protein E2C01_041989 [Portunus trituberculatus]|uniref:Uncharacterized protein n=1 Tax=Portunus trituberculatus TaxID=210409 RepID=A0A5B7FKL4_PORTR|nr:hypothetical protein [Portunus trituberculatus]